MFDAFVVKKLTVFSVRCLLQVLDMAAVLEVVTILERLPITKEALEVKLRVLSSSKQLNRLSTSTMAGHIFLGGKIMDEKPRCSVPHVKGFYRHFSFGSSLLALP